MSETKKRAPGGGRKPNVEKGVPTKVRIHITLPPDLHDWFDEAARRKGVKRSQLIERVLEEYRRTPRIL